MHFHSKFDKNIGEINKNQYKGELNGKTRHFLIEKIHFEILSYFFVSKPT